MALDIPCPTRRNGWSTKVEICRELLILFGLKKIVVVKRGIAIRASADPRIPGYLDVHVGILKPEGGG